MPNKILVTFFGDICAQLSHHLGPRHAAASTHSMQTLQHLPSPTSPLPHLLTNLYLTVTSHTNFALPKNDPITFTWLFRVEIYFGSDVQSSQSAWVVNIRDLRWQMNIFALYAWDHINAHQPSHVTSWSTEVKWRNIIVFNVRNPMRDLIPWRVTWEVTVQKSCMLVSNAINHLVQKTHWIHTHSCMGESNHTCATFVVCHTFRL